ncbi:hypothetical protein FF38_14543 [Lucilia cuprina]|uniref:THAP-type domain-containing protein n=1 Tax=Lucilia cuprina TaxID=7375 RepID=A0A0L0CI06_LUCCU|nr:hypothetical protein FF38_14543 [Lucilia cuprina]
MSCLFPKCECKKHHSSVSNIHFFKIPTIPYIRKEWLKVCNIEDDDLPGEPLVCSLHFSRQDLKK